MKKKIFIIITILIIIAIASTTVILIYNKNNNKNNNSEKEVDSSEIIREDIEETNSVENNISGQYYDKKINDLASAKESIESVKDELNLSSIDDLNDGKEDTFGTVFNTYNFDQYYNGLRYYGHSVKAYTDKDGNSKGIINFYKEIKDFNTTPKYSLEKLEKIAIEKTGKGSKIKDNELVIYDLDENTKTLAYIFNMTNGATVIVDANSKELLAFDDGIETLTQEDIEKYKIDDELLNMFEDDMLETDQTIGTYILADRERKIFMCDYNNSDSSFSYYMWNKVNDINKKDFKIKEETIETVSKIYDYYDKSLNYQSFDGNGININVCTNVKSLLGGEYSN